MNRDKIKRIYDLHAWTGILVGWFIFVVSFSGIPALFYAEITTWENTNYRITLNDMLIDISPFLDTYVDESIGNGEVQTLSVMLPTPERPFYQALLRYRENADGKTIRSQRTWNPNNGQILTDKGFGLAAWLRDFHRFLMLPRTLGRTLVGVAGILLLISVITGIITHRKLFKEMFTWRLDRSVRLKWQDSHKAIGLWSLPYVLMIAFTGAFLGLLVIMLPVTGALVYKGDRTAITNAVNGPEIRPSGEKAKMASIRPLYDQVTRETGVRPRSLIVERWGDQTAHYVFVYRVQDKLIRFGKYTVSAVDGRFIDHQLSLNEGVAWRIISAITPLHYATYGGLWLKILYALLAAALCILIVTGSMMWLEKRLHGNEGKRSKSFYRILSRLTTGLSTGVVFASIAVFYGDKLLNVMPEDRLFWTGVVYFASWKFVVLYALVRTDEYHACREILIMAGTGLIGLPVLNLLVTDMSIIQAFENNAPYVAGVDIAAFVLGVLALYLIRFLPRGRQPVRHAL